MMFQPPAGWKPSITDATASGQTLRQTLTLYVDNLPDTLDDSTFNRILDCCGRVQKWVRIVDPKSGKPKPFGFVTYEYGASAIRCKSILSNLPILGNDLMIKAGSKDTAALEAILEVIYFLCLNACMSTYMYTSYKINGIFLRVAYTAITPCCDYVLLYANIPLG